MSAPITAERPRSTQTEEWAARVDGAAETHGQATVLPSALEGESVGEEKINRLRRILIEAAFEGDGGRRRNREAIRRLLGPIAAARKNGKTWEELAEMLATGGVKLAPATLRNYVSEFRAEADMARMLREQVSLIVATRERVLHHQDGQDQGKVVAEIAAKRKRGMTSKPKLVSNSELFGGREAAPAAETGTPTPTGSTSPPPSRTPPAESRVTGVTPKASSAPASRRTTAPEAGEPARSTITAGQAPSIALLMELAKTVNERAELSEDVLLKDGEHAYYASGPPLDRPLSMRQVRLLKSSGRLVAKASPTGTEARTAGDFVPMKKQL